MNELYLVKIINISHGDVKSAFHIYPHKIYICCLHLSSSFSCSFWVLIIHSRREHDASDKAWTSSLCVTHTHTHTHQLISRLVLLLMWLPSSWPKPQHFVHLAAELSNDTRAVVLATSYQAAGRIFTVARAEICTDSKFIKCFSCKSRQRAAKKFLKLLICLFMGTNIILLFHFVIICSE